MVRPHPLPPDGNISNRRLAQIRRRHREKILKQAQRQKDRQEAAEQRRLDKLAATNKIVNTIEKCNTIELEPERKAETLKVDNPNSPRRILRDIQMQRRAKRKKSVPVANGEFHPDKLKRKVVYKKITLTANQELVTLGSVNKRKRNDPKKGEDYEQALNTDMPSDIKPKLLKRKVRNATREETVEELIMRIEETDSLTDEDLMEILTCPSPVWWEEPLNRFYFDEEPINKKLQKPNRKRPHQASIKQNKTVNHIDKLEINLKNRDEKFVSKRCTLEKILNNIKDNIEPAKHFNRKMCLKRPWKYLDERNPAFGLKRNSKGRFLKKKFNSSPITISDVSDREENTLNSINRTKITTKSTDLPITTKSTDLPITTKSTDLPITTKSTDLTITTKSTDLPIVNNEITTKSTDLPTAYNEITTKTTNLDIATSETVAITETSDVKTINIDSATSKNVDITKNPKINNIVLTVHKKDTAEIETKSNNLPYNNITKGLIEVNTINGPCVTNADTQINLKGNKNEDSIDFKTTKATDSPKAIIWTSNTGEQKVITFIQDTEMSSDVEIVTESDDINIPTELPPLKWYPKTDAIEDTKKHVNISNVTCDASNEQLSDDKNDNSYDNNSLKDSNCEVQDTNIETQSNIVN